MFKSPLMVVFLLCNIGLYSHSVSCQFYVDIEHALPRFGKRVVDDTNEGNIYSEMISKHNNKVNAKSEDFFRSFEKKINLLYKLFGPNYNVNKSNK